MQVQASTYSNVLRNVQRRLATKVPSASGQTLRGQQSLLRNPVATSGSSVSSYMRCSYSSLSYFATTFGSTESSLPNTIQAHVLARNQRAPSKGNSRYFSDYPSHTVVGLPSLSPTMESGSIASWTLGEGDSFAAGDVFCSVETDKATVDFEAQDDGVVAKILVDSGPDELKVGHPIMVIVEDEDDVAAFKDFVADGASAASTADAATETSTPEPATSSSPPEPVTESPAPVPSPAAPSVSSSGDRVVASPLAHMLAKELGYDISMIPGTGPDGRVIAADVKEFVPSATASTETAAPAQAAMAGGATVPSPIEGVGYTDYPLSDEAREIAARLTHAKQNVPHYYLTVDISADEILKLRSKLNESLGGNGEEDKTLGVYELFLKAAAMSMKAVPSANASWMDSVVRVYDSVDINVVVGSGDSVYTPVIRDCSGKGVGKISEELKTAVSAVEPVEDGDEAAGSPVLGGLGTFTVMNLGMYGIKSCAPIIREPQSCALALGALENRIVPNDDPESDQIYKESVVMTATLSCDHRVVDGAVGAQWLAAFKSHVENPTTLLL